MVDRIVETLRSGGVVLLPTDTVYGLAASPEFPDAVARIFTLKRRPGTVNLPNMVASEEGVEALGLDINPRARRLLRSPLVPGALTLAMGFRDGPAVPWLAGRDEVALRIPNDAQLLAVLRRAGPLLVTSANAHGSPTPETLAQALAQLDGRPELAVDGGVLHSVPSTLVNCRHDPPVIEREGVVPRDEIARYLQ
jgi:L-threonylcarbamoyladenylate synthase